jgi:hypothetical protein
MPPHRRQSIRATAAKFQSGLRRTKIFLPAHPRGIESHHRQATGLSGYSAEKVLIAITELAYRRKSPQSPRVH